MRETAQQAGNEGTVMSDSVGASSSLCCECDWTVMQKAQGRVGESVRNYECPTMTPARPPAHLSEF